MISAMPIGIWVVFFVSLAFSLQSLPLQLTRQTYVDGAELTIPSNFLLFTNGRHFIKTTNEGSEVVHECFIDAESLTCDPSTITVEKSGYCREIPIRELLLQASSYSQKPSTIDLKSTLYNSKADSDSDEIVDWVSVCGEVLCHLPRSLIHKYNILHRGIGAILLNEQGEIFVHKRSRTKKIFPSMYDMFIGGVSLSGESSIQTLLREIEEEVGVRLNDADIPTYIAVDLERIRSYTPQHSTDKNRNNSARSKVKYLGQTICATSHNHCIVDCYAVLFSRDHMAAIRFADGEIEEGNWHTVKSVFAMVDLQRNQFVPDGLQIWDALPPMLMGVF